MKEKRKALTIKYVNNAPVEKQGLLYQKIGGRYALNAYLPLKFCKEICESAYGFQALKFDFFFDIRNGIFYANTDLFHGIPVANGNGIIL